MKGFLAGVILTIVAEGVAAVAIMITIADGFSLFHSFCRSKRCSLSSEKIALLFMMVVSSNIKFPSKQKNRQK